MSFYVNDPVDLGDPEALEAAISGVFEARASERNDEPIDVPESGGGDSSEDPIPAVTPEEVPEEEPGDTPPEAEPDESAPSAFRVGDREFAAEQAQQLLDLYDWVENMDPQFAEDIGRLASGQFTVAPREMQQAAPPPPEPPIDPLAGADLDLVPPEFVEVVRNQQAQLGELQQHLSEVREAAARANDYAAHQTFESQANVAMSSFGQRHQLDDEFLQEVSRAATNAVPLFAQTSNDPTVIFDQALEHTLWTTPAFRAKLQTVEAQRLADETASLSQNIQDKVNVQSSALSSSGSVPRSEPSIRNLTPQERTNAMVADVANYLNQS